jgi:hypothetical protein
MNINMSGSKGDVADTGCKNVHSYRYGKSADMGTKDVIRQEQLLEGEKTIQYNVCFGIDLGIPVSYEIKSNKTILFHNFKSKSTIHFFFGIFYMDFAREISIFSPSSLGLALISLESLESLHGSIAQ